MADESGESPFSGIVSSTTTASSLLLDEAAKQALGIGGGLFTIRIRTTEKPPDDHAIYSFVGRVASEWARLEHFLDAIIWDLAELEHAAGACITAQMIGATPRYRTIIAQLTLRTKADERWNKYIGKINGLMNSTYDPQDRRNRIVHDPWYVTFERGPGLLSRMLSEKPAQFKSMPQKTLQFGIVEIDVTEIEKTSTDIKKLSERAEQLLTEISAQLRASPKRRP